MSKIDCFACHIDPIDIFKTLTMSVFERGEEGGGRLGPVGVDEQLSFL